MAEKYRCDSSTHHYACDCREAAHAAELAILRAENERLLEFLVDVDAFVRKAAAILERLKTGGE